MPSKPDEIGAAALAEFEEVGVIDDAGEIRVLEIDAHRQYMRIAVDAAAEVWPFIRLLAHTIVMTSSISQG